MFIDWVAVERTRHWNDVTDSDVAQEVGAESGLSVEADPTSETFPYILQRNESNIAFLKRLASRNNFQVRVEKDKLVFKKQPTLVKHKIFRWVKMLYL